MANAINLCPILCRGECGNHKHGYLPCPNDCRYGRDESRLVRDEEGFVCHPECATCEGAGEVHVDYYDDQPDDVRAEALASVPTHNPGCGDMRCPHCKPTLIPAMLIDECFATLALECIEGAL